MLLINLYRGYRKKSALKNFQTNTILGDRAIIHHTAHCVNSGEKGQITIGEHSEIKGKIECYGNERCSTLFFGSRESGTSCQNIKTIVK